MKRIAFPFTAIVGQEAMKTSLVLNAVDPSIGGVLISGHKGTGKSTAVRGLASLLPKIQVVKGCPYHCDPDSPQTMHRGCRRRLDKGQSLETAIIPMPLVDLPLNATEDRLVGALHIEKALKEGEREFEPGLLAAANRGILYVDEVNLLDDHLVDMLLDAAASGINQVEREGISYNHPARFILVGTMNPEEGTLRPQFLDRFGLFVAVSGVQDPEKRAGIVRRSLEFEKSPDEFSEKFETSEREIRDRIVKAREALSRVTVPGEITDLAVRLALESKARGHRAEIVMTRTARALAALAGRKKAGKQHLAEAAGLVLPHRIGRDPSSMTEGLEQTLQGIIVRILGKKKRRSRG